MSKAIYSGPGKTGICICGCPWNVHHLSCRMTQKSIDETGEYYVPGACLKHGCNETEGLKYNELTDEWEVHCMGYKDKGE